MAQTANLTMRIDKTLRDEAEALFAGLGLSLSSAVGIYFRQAVRQKRIPFELSLEDDPFNSEANMRVLSRSIRDADNGILIVKTLDELREMEK